MKKTIAILTAIFVLIFSFSASAAEINFTDVKADDWFYKNLQELTEKNIASGYPDGTFQPGGTLKFEEFIKMLVVATENELAPQKEGQEWYQIYVDKALEIKYITKQQKSLIGQNIDRQTMTEILYNVLTEKEEIKVYTEVEFEYLANKLTDVNKTDVKTLAINGIGVISGYPDGTFNPANTLTRAEAVAVISRVINPSLRNPVKIALRDANGIIDAKDLESVAIENTKYKELKEYIQEDLRGNITYKVENVIKADVSMFPIKFGNLVITGVEKLPAKRAPYYGDTSRGWKGSDEKDAIIIHAYPIDNNDKNDMILDYVLDGLRIALVNKSGEVSLETVTKVSSEGKEVYNKTKEMFPDYALGESAMVKINQQFTTMRVGSKGFELGNIDKIIFMDRFDSTNDVLEINAKGIREVK